MKETMGKLKAVKNDGFKSPGGKLKIEGGFSDSKMDGKMSGKSSGKKK